MEIVSIIIAVFIVYELIIILRIILDEEGKLKGKALNKEATELFVGEEIDDTSAAWDFDYIVGDVMILSGDARLS